MSRPIGLVTGFGPFLDVEDNPSGRLAREIDGRGAAGFDFRGLVLPVSYERGPNMAIDEARRIGARFVVGFGVSRRARGALVETLAFAGRTPGQPDVDGVCDGVNGEEAIVNASADTELLARCLGAELSEDAGRYVCNAWLYRVTRALDVPVGFVHLPLAGESMMSVLSRLGGYINASRGFADG